MSNPFTRFLTQWSHNDRLVEFVDYWDQLETVVVNVYRQKMPIEEANENYAQIWHWLRTNYPKWEPVLRPYWQQTLVGGKVAARDPFRYLIDISQPADIRADWFAMQQLPAAREALNQYILEQST